MAYGRSRRRGGGIGSMLKGRLMIALIMVGFAVVSYFMSTKKERNPITGEMQTIAMSVDEEIAMGLRAAPQMAAQHGGLYDSQSHQNQIDRIGNKLVQSSEAAGSDYQFDFHLLADRKTVNAFALPGGQIFMTASLWAQLGEAAEEHRRQGGEDIYEDCIAGVLGHEIAHVVARHSAQQMAKAKLTNGISTAVIMAGGQGGGQMGAMIGQMINTKYGRDDELESDKLGIRFMIQSGYNPYALIKVMDVLESSASRGAKPPEFLSTHPSPDNRVEKIKAEIERIEAQGGLRPMGVESPGGIQIDEPRSSGKASKPGEVYIPETISLD